MDFQSPASSVVFYNPTYEALYAPVEGPENPLRRKKVINQNHLSGKDRRKLLERQLESAGGNWEGF